MWPGSMHGSLIRNDCDLLGSFVDTELLNGWLQGRSISIRQDTGINNNEPSNLRGRLVVELPGPQALASPEETAGSESPELILFNHPGMIKEVKWDC
ncbi:uncharacterized protein LOC142765481 isoform X4 [Rhipicephalus microplus]|uniref:uncharacterized protein LOC142765481 isoform X4 n=1 Tax=Rhipicephalus microplus TaxID=6941 RepID=UPI003F6B10B7